MPSGASASASKKPVQKPKVSRKDVVTPRIGKDIIMEECEQKTNP